jgi:hypothetical protein
VLVSTYLINIQSLTALQGGAPLERLSSCPHEYSALRLFGCVCYVLLVARESTKLTSHIECYFVDTVIIIRFIGVGI